MVKIADLMIDPEIQLETRGTDANTVGGYVEAISGGAEFPPAIVFSDNGTLWLSDGFHRVEACRFLGLAEIEADIRLGTREDAMIYAATANVENGRPMSRAQKREAGERLLRMTDWSQSRIAQELAVDPKSVTNWKLSMENSIDRDVVVNRGGTTYMMDVSSIGKTSLNSRRCENQTRPPFVSHNAGDNEWYTPPEFIKAARDIMGNIDLDPASTLVANEIIQADRFYIKEDNGLSKDWAGKVWMNPPYAPGLIGKFIAKLIKHIKTGEVTDAIVLVNNATETSWFSELISIASAVCFPLGRIKFWAPDKVSAPLQGQAVIYIGNEADKFLLRFQQFGWIARVFKGDESGSESSVS